MEDFLVLLYTYIHLVSSTILIVKFPDILRNALVVFYFEKRKWRLCHGVFGLMVGVVVVLVGRGGAGRLRIAVVIGSGGGGGLRQSQ